MNEFIVWDEEDNESITLEQYQEKYPKEQGFNDTYNEQVSRFLDNYFGCDTFNYIGKTDINDKKIYADCSIVKLDIYINGICIHGEKGYFKYDTKELRYNFHRLNFISSRHDNIRSYVDERFKNIKIIGTLQENPELLK